MKDELEKYEHLEELAERFFAAKQRHLRHQAKNPADVTRTIRIYFASDLYQNLETRRSEIREFANERSSWIRVGEILMAFIDGCLRNKRAEQKKLLAMAIDLVRTKAAHRDQRSAVLMKTIGTLLFILILRKTEK